MKEIEEIRTEMQEAIDLVRKLTKADPAAILRRVEILRAIARAARGNAAARAYIERLLEAPAKRFPEHAATFRVTYLDGETRPSPRQLARRFYIDPSTVAKRNRHIFEAMLPAAFGVYGIFLTDEGLEYDAETPESHGKRCGASGRSKRQPGAKAPPEGAERANTGKQGAERDVSPRPAFFMSLHHLSFRRL